MSAVEGEVSSKSGDFACEHYASGEPQSRQLGPVYGVGQNEFLRKKMSEANIETVKRDLGSLVKKQKQERVRKQKAQQKKERDDQERREKALRDLDDERARQL